MTLLRTRDHENGVSSFSVHSILPYIIPCCVNTVSTSLGHNECGLVQFASRNVPQSEIKPLFLPRGQRPPAHFSSNGRVELLTQ